MAREECQNTLLNSDNVGSRSWVFCCHGQPQQRKKNAMKPTLTREGTTQTADRKTKHHLSKVSFAAPPALPCFAAAARNGYGTPTGRFASVFPPPTAGLPLPSSPAAPPPPPSPQWAALDSAPPPPLPPPGLAGEFLPEFTPLGVPTGRRTLGLLSDVLGRDDLPNVFTTSAKATVGGASGFLSALCLRSKS